jgi:protein O-mannose beta-1,4-N-acetylglucosaminyltransferase
MKERYRETLLYLSSIDNHPYFEWNFVEASPFAPELQNINVRYEDTPHFLFKRLHPENIMHNLHDDVLNMYFQIKKYITKPTEPGRMELPFSLFSQRILLLDQYEGTGSTRPFQYLSNHPIRFSSYLTLKKTSTDITCFREAFVGNSKITRWYQYGFYDLPQGPIDNLPNGMHVREVASWFTKRVGLALGDDELYPPKKLIVKKPVIKDNSHLDFVETDLIVIMSRTKNRIMINEAEIAKELSRHYKLESVFLRNEDQTFEEQIKILRRARVVLGMHGSILVMALFCRRGTVLLEM